MCQTEYVGVRAPTQAEEMAPRSVPVTINKTSEGAYSVSIAGLSAREMGVALRALAKALDRKPTGNRHGHSGDS